MKRTLILAAAILAVLAAGQGSAAPEPAKKKLLHAFLASAGEDKPKTTFPADAPKIRALWKGDALHFGDFVRGVWMVEDIGLGTTKPRELNEATVLAYKADDDGIFSLVRPREGWPAGKYRFEIYVNQMLAQALDFTIEAGPSVETH